LTINVAEAAAVTKTHRGRGRQTSHFLALNVNISKTVGDTSKVTIND